MMMLMVLVTCAMPHLADVDALLALRPLLDPRNASAALQAWSCPAGPGSEATCACAWPGVTCDEEGRVVEM